MRVVTRVMGLILTAIAMGMLPDGIKRMLPILAVDSSGCMSVKGTY